MNSKPNNKNKEIVERVQKIEDCMNLNGLTQKCTISIRGIQI